MTSLARSLSQLLYTIEYLETQQMLQMIWSCHQANCSFVLSTYTICPLLVEVYTRKITELENNLCIRDFIYQDYNIYFDPEFQLPKIDHLQHICKMMCVQSIYSSTALLQQIIKNVMFINKILVK